MNKYKIDIDENNEIWCKIEGFEEYEVSSFGNFRNIKTNRTLKGCKNDQGYHIIKIKYKIYKSHRIIAETFLNNPYNKKFVDHIDGNILNNNILNLRWATPQENSYNTKKKKSFNNSESYSMYKGVRKTNKGRYICNITKDCKNYHLGTFDTEKEAGEAYNKKALELFGEFAKLNI